MTTPVDVGRSAALRWRNAVIAAFTLGGTMSATFGTRMPSIQTALNASQGVIGALLMTISVGAMVGLTVAPAIHRQLGGRRAIVSALSTMATGLALAGLVTGLLHSVPLTFIAFAVFGFGVGTVDPMINVEGASVERALAKTLLPLMHAFWSGGIIIGAGISSGSAAISLPIEWQFLAQAALVVAGALVLSRHIPQAPPVVPVTPATVPAKFSFPERLRHATRSLRDLRLVLIGMVMLGAGLGEGTARGWLTLAARNDHGMTEALAGTLFVVFAVAQTLTRVVGGPAVDRFGRDTTVRWTSALGVLGVAVFILAPSIWWLLAVSVVLWGVGVGLGYPLGMAAAADSGPDAVARVSFVALFGATIGLATPPLIGWAADHIGLLNTLWSVVVILLIAGIVAPVLRPKAGVEAGSADQSGAAEQPG